MQLQTINSESQRAWWRVRRYLKSIRDWSENGDNPYSLLLCLTLLGVLMLIVKIGH